MKKIYLFAISNYSLMPEPLVSVMPQTVLLPTCRMYAHYATSLLP